MRDGCEMKKALRLFGGLVVLGGAGLTYLFLALPPRFEVPAITLPTAPERLENGRYLANHVALCMDCHSMRRQDLFAAPLDEATFGAGGEAFPGDFGVLYSSNITPAGLSGWSDEELYRAVVTGVRPGRGALFPLMPYPHYAAMSTSDVEDILAYIRSLKPIEGSPPPSRLNFPLNLIVRTMPGPPKPVPRPEAGSPEYGAYLTNMASCTDCHTPMKKGAPAPGMDLAGGQEFHLPSGVVRSANITPDKETGIGSWTREGFIARFKSPTAPHNVDTPLQPGQVNTLMPWRQYAGMTEQDLGAIYDHLMTLPPVKNRVQHFGGKVSES